MQQLKNVTKEIAITNLIKTLAQSYETVATIEMKKTRDSVLTKRDFMLRILEIYVQVKENYKNEIEKMRNGKFKMLKSLARKKQSDENNFLTINKKKGDAVVLLTSNRSMVGSVNLKVYKEFSNFLQDNKGADIIVIGKIGKNFLDSTMPNQKYNYFDLPVKSKDASVIKNITDVLMEYKNIEVFHGKYLNLVNQVGVKTPLTANLDQNTSIQPKKVDYLFEPSLKQILNFFETQIFSSLFSQTLSETNLANLGSRIQSMEQTVVGTEDYLKALNSKKVKAKKLLAEKKQKQRIIASLIVANGN